MMSKNLKDVPVNPIAACQKLAALAPKEPDRKTAGKPDTKGKPRPKKSQPRGSQDFDLGPLDVEKYLSAHGYNFRAKPKGSKTIYVLDHCLFDPSHVGQDAGIVQESDGRLRYKCFHDSCRTQTWADARSLISGQESLAPFCQGYDPGKYKPRDSTPKSPLDSPATPPRLPPPEKVDPQIFYDDKRFNPQFLAKYLQSRMSPLVYDGAQFYHYQSTGVWKPLDPEEIAQVAERALDKEARSARITDAIKLLGHRMFIRADDFQHNTDYLNVLNGMIKIGIFGETHSHGPEYYSRIQLPVTYDDKIDCPRWDQFLREVFPDDPEKAKALQAYFGYCLLPHCRHQRCLFMIGSGANGKSVVIDVLVSILGVDNVCSLPLQLMGERFLVGQLKDKLVNVASELATNRPVDTANFKDAVAGGLLMADQKHGKPFAFYSIAKHIFSMNEVPKITDKSYGFQRRPLVIMFHERFEGDRRDPELTQQLIKERAGIFNWMMEGLYIVLEKGDLYVPRVVEKDTALFVKSTNPVLLFVDDCCKLEPHCFVKPPDLYVRYKNWCEEGKNRPLSRNRFYDQILIHYPKVEKTRGADDEKARIYKGIGLRWEV